MLSIFNLTFTMMKTTTQMSELAQLERQVASGREFWGKVFDDLWFKQQQLDKMYLSREKDRDAVMQEHVTKGDCSKRAIEKILHRKDRWIGLQEDMATVKSKLEELNRWMVGLPYERKELPFLCDMLTLQHQATYYHFLNSLESILTVYRDNGNDEYFAKVMEVRSAAIKSQSGATLLLRNAYYVTQAGIAAAHI